MDGKIYYARLLELILTISMRSSKLQTCLHVLKVLQKRQQTTFDDLLSTTQLEKNQLQYTLDLLIENLLTKEQTTPNNKTTYTTTERGNRVLNFFSINGISPFPQ